MEIIIHFDNQRHVLHKDHIYKRQYRDPPSLYIVKQFVLFCLQQLCKFAFWKCFLGEEEICVCNLQLIFNLLHHGMFWKCLHNQVCLMHNIMDNKHERIYSFAYLCCHTTTLNICKRNNTIKTKKKNLLLISSIIKPP
jgi:hypothetical protein